MKYWAARPASYELKYTRIEKAATPLDAVRMAFGARLNPKTDKGKWLVKDLGSRVNVLHSDKKRIALLTDPAGWFDPS